MSSIPLKPDEARKLVLQWQATGAVLTQLHVQNLACQSAEESRQNALDMLDLASQLPEDPRRISTSGLIEMQRLLAGLRARAER
jgi:hypothetical protein